MGGIFGLPISFGSFTPTMAPSTNTPTPAVITGVTGYYFKILGLVVAFLSGTITTNNSGDGNITFSGLPFTAAALGYGVGRRDVVGGVILQAQIDAASTAVAVRLADGSYPGADGAVIGIVALYRA